jgi:probable HAF family extracellular repeat protein
MRHQLFRVTEMAVVLLVFGRTPATAQVTFQKFPLRDAFINDMSADGSVVVGNYIDIARKGQAFRWTAGGEENIGGNMDEVAISRDGKTIVGRAADSNGILNAAIWQSGKNWRLLGGVPGGIPDGRSEISAAYGVSANGSVIVGTATIKNGIDYHGFRWEASKGVVDLGALQGDSSFARHVSADGNVIVGYDMVAKGGYSPVPGGRIGAIFWGGLESKLHGFGYAGEVRGTNAVGSILVGQFHLCLS